VLINVLNIDASQRPSAHPTIHVMCQKPTSTEVYGTSVAVGSKRSRSWRAPFWVLQDRPRHLQRQRRLLSEAVWESRSPLVTALSPALLHMTWYCEMTQHSVVLSWMHCKSAHTNYHNYSSHFEAHMHILNLHTVLVTTQDSAVRVLQHNTVLSRTCEKIDMYTDIV
jgi:hypothetical protein